MTTPPGDTLWNTAFTGPPIATHSGAPTHRPRGRRGRRGSVKASSFRPDIQGLRAVAVLAVVVNHLSGHPIGGFVGVDVFFVISGYLITGLLLRDLNAGHGFIGFITGFYRRRIRRLFPAALVVTVVTIFVAHTVFNSARYHQTWKDGLWSSVFWANWHFISIGTNYFTANGPTSPFQHYWSLSVEEQFYVVWPLALLVIGSLVVLLARAHGQAARRVRVIVGTSLAVIVCAVSLWFAFGQSKSDPVTAYFSTFDRAWELGLGALLACVVPSMRGSRWLLTLISWVGLAAIGVSLFVTTTSHFPAPGALLPCLGAAAVIAAVSPTAMASNWILTNPVSVFVGNISYSVYLVHFPVIILLAAKMPSKGPYYYAIAVLLSTGLSIALYAFVERPVLNSGWLLPRGAKQPEAEPTRHLALAAAVAAVAALVTMAAWPGTQAAATQQEAQIAAALATSTTSTSAVVAATPKLDALVVQIRNALLATTWPALNPSMSSAIAHNPEPDDIEKCGSINLSTPAACTFGPANAKHTMYLVGDSTAVAYGEALRDVAEASGWDIRIGAAFGCAFISAPAVGPFGQDGGCVKHNDALVAEINAARPSLVISTHAYINYFALGSTTPWTDQQWAGTLGDELDKVKSSAGKIVIMPAAPFDKTMSICDVPGSSPANCDGRLKPEWVSRAGAEQNLAAQIGGVFIPSVNWFCLAGLCPAFDGTTPVFHDQVHITPQYADILAPVMREAFLGAGLLGSNLPASTSAADTSATKTPVADALGQEIESALLTTTWPQLNPSIDSVLTGPFVPRDLAPCSSLTLQSASECTFGDPAATGTIELVGDSQSVAWADTFRAALSSEPNWKLRVAGADYCSFASTVLLAKSANDASMCLAHNQAVVAEVKRTRPALLVVANLTNSAADVASVTAEIDAVQGYVGKVVILGAPPEVKDPRQCFTSGSSPAACVSSVLSDYPSWVRQMNSVAASVSGVYVDVQNWFCYNGYCPAFVGATPVRFDNAHMSLEYAAKLAPVLVEQFKVDGLL